MSYERKLAEAVRYAVVSASFIKQGRYSSGVGFRIVDIDAIIASIPRPEPVAWDEIEQIANDRYKVVPSDQSMFWRFAVVAGDGEQQLYIGREIECRAMADKFTGAFLDGAFMHHKLCAPVSAEPDARLLAAAYQMCLRINGSEKLEKLLEKEWHKLQEAVEAVAEQAKPAPELTGTSL